MFTYNKLISLKKKKMFTEDVRIPYRTALRNFNLIIFNYLQPSIKIFKNQVFMLNDKLITHYKRYFILNIFKHFS